MVASCSSCVTREGPAAGGHEFILPASPAPLGWSQQHKERLGRAPGGGFHHQLTVPEAGGSVQAAQGITCTPLCALGCKCRLPQPTGKRWPGRIRNFQGAIPRCCGEHQLLPPSGRSRREGLGGPSTGEFLCSAGFSASPKSGVSFSPRSGSGAHLPQRVAGPGRVLAVPFPWEGTDPLSSSEPGREGQAVPAALISMALTLGTRV